MPSRYRIEDNLNDESFLGHAQRPMKRRQASGINVRLSKMLQRAAMSHISTSSDEQVKRARGTPNHSSSSVTACDAPSSPVSSMLKSAKGRNIGEAFSTIKSGAAMTTDADVYSSGFLRNNVKSWKGVDVSMCESEVWSNYIYINVCSIDRLLN
jgi:hypothetical protein